MHISSIADKNLHTSYVVFVAVCIIKAFFNCYYDFSSVFVHDISILHMKKVKNSTRNPAKKNSSMKIIKILALQMCCSLLVSFCVVCVFYSKWCKHHLHKSHMVKRLVKSQNVNANISAMMFCSAWYGRDQKRNMSNKHTNRLRMLIGGCVLDLCLHELDTPATIFMKWVMFTIVTFSVLYVGTCPLSNVRPERCVHFDLSKFWKYFECLIYRIIHLAWNIN